jgi:homoserine dehydrogenase
MSTITVLKFGGSVLKSEADLAKVVHEIYQHWRRGKQVLTVVSAFGGTTDALIEKTKAFGSDADPETIASLLFTGEATSAALLAMALKRSGVPSKLLTPEQVGIRTTGDALDGEPVSANVDRLNEELEQAVVVVSGFAGVTEDGDLTLLGRGGTDLTALFLAQQLAAKCILLKDVDGLYESNPANSQLHPRRFLNANYETALRLGGQLIQPKAVRFAEEHGQSFKITSIGANVHTSVGAFKDKVDDASNITRPLRVALLGCGTVGGGVYQRLSALPEFFEIVGVVNLDPKKALDNGVLESHLERDVEYLITQDCDVVIELIGGIEPARAYIEHALKLRRHVITANKALIAEFGRELNALAHENNVTIRYSASVGGALPALEAVTPNGTRPRAFMGIINGTCNFVIDQLASGSDFGAAVRLAQKEGFAEADPTLDLNGTDAAQKLSLLIRQSFGVALPVSAIQREGIEKLTPARVAEAGKRGNVFRLIAACSETANGIEASVGPVQLPDSHPFAAIKGAENCLVIETAGGYRKTIKGRGAGRYATTESVMADLFDLRRDHAKSRPFQYKEAHA